MGAITGFFGRLFGTQAAGEKLIDGMASAADKLIYTGEERADDAAKARSEGMQVYMKWLESTSGSRLARRMLAAIVTVPWALEQLTALGFDVLSIWWGGIDANTNGFIIASDKIFAHANSNNELVGVVLLFYFGGPVASDAIGGMVQKWTNKGGAK